MIIGFFCWIGIMYLVPLAIMACGFWAGVGMAIALFGCALAGLFTI